jgi:hypothetical protein
MAIPIARHVGFVDRESLLRQVRGEYLEMPGLNLTLEQAMRMWGVERQACLGLLESLIDCGFLRRGPRSGYVLAQAPRRI